MAEQLDLFGIWHRVVREPLPVPAPPPEPAVVPVPVLPGQQALFAGRHVGEAAVDAALAALDAAALRAAIARAAHAYADYAPAARWPDWASGIERLTEGSPAQQLARAFALGAPEAGLPHFAAMGPDRLAALAEAAVLRAVRIALAADGPGARDAGGELLAGLLLRRARDGGDGAAALRAEAHAHLEAHLAGHPADGPALRGLAECSACRGGPEEAAAVWQKAALVDPDGTAACDALPADFADAAGQAEALELPGAPGDWVAALTDLAGLARLPAPERWPPVPPAVATRPGIAFAAELAALRAARRRRAPDAEVHALKAALLRRAPALREALRPV